VHSLEGTTYRTDVESLLESGVEMPEEMRSTFSTINGYLDNKASDDEIRQGNNVCLVNLAEYDHNNPGKIDEWCSLPEPKTKFGKFLKNLKEWISGIDEVLVEVKKVVDDFNEFIKIFK
jgi:hypothetical protein